MTPADDPVPPTTCRLPAVVTFIRFVALTEVGAVLVENPTRTLLPPSVTLLPCTDTPVKPALPR